MCTNLTNLGDPAQSLLTAGRTNDIHRNSWQGVFVDRAHVLVV